MLWKKEHTLTPIKNIIPEDKRRPFPISRLFFGMQSISPKKKKSKPKINPVKPIIAIVSLSPPNKMTKEINT